MGLQYIYTQQDVRNKIFKILEEKVSPNTDKTNGRPSMDLWKILVMGSLRLNLNCDYDRLHEMVNNHKTIREMLGHSLFDTDAPYHLQTIKDNVKLLTTETLSEINKVVVDAGHVLVKKKDKSNLRGRCDSFVVETNVHFPTDINLLFDATRKVIELTTRLCDDFGASGWRQSKHNIKEMKKQVFKLEKVFSVFEPHTEWVCKGKSGVPVELGLKVAILEDQIGFIFGHQIMQNQTDEQVAVPIVQAAKDNFPALNCCSFDKGFHSPLNQIELRKILDAVALPKKGKLSKQEGEYQHSEQFKAIRKKHSAVESAINALERRPL